MQEEKMVMVACGWRHTISVSSSGWLYTYGWSKYGQLGHGDFKDHLLPHKLEALHDSFISQVIFQVSHFSFNFPSTGLWIVKYHFENSEFM